MKTFILIIYLKYGYSGGWLFPEFNTEQACESALTQIKKEENVIIGFCTDKG